MASTFFGLTIATSGLYASQNSMNTTAHNIANAQTTGYSKQVSTQKAGVAISTSSSYGMVGTGVGSVSVDQIRDSYYDTKYRTNNSILGNYSTKEYYMSGIEGVFSETTSDGLNSIYNSYVTALQDLKNNPSESSNRNQVVSMAEGLTDFVNSMANSLTTLQEECNEQIKTTVEQINSIAQQISTLNKQINTIELTGQKANDLRDQRNNLLDQLSEYANITTSETTASNGLQTFFEVRIDGQLLVDNYNYNTLEVQSTDSKNNQSDIDGLYNIQWSSGLNFNQSSSTLGGNLQALFEMRDGNNQEYFTGSASGTAGSNTLTVTGSNCNDVTKLSIPEEKGVIQIGNKAYTYTGFDVSIDADGNYTYTFTLENKLSEAVTDGTSMSIGSSTDCKGIPYYMNQLTALARTYAMAVNQIQNSGQDAYGNAGVDMFTGTDVRTGLNYNFDEAATSFSSKVATDASGNVVTSNGYVNTSYYSMTASNFTINSAMSSDPNLFAVTDDTDKGVESTDILDQVIALSSDKTVFKQGTPGDFIQKLVSDIATDTEKANMFVTSQENIVKSVNSQRMSISGVDEDEEGLDLVKFQNAYNLNSKVIQTMNELYDTLINGLGI